MLDSLSSSRRKPLAPEVFRLRMIKSECEQRLMRRAADVSAHAHAKVGERRFGFAIANADLAPIIGHAVRAAGTNRSGLSSAF
jgi:Xaa-Pro aminopeptidase